MSFANPIWLWGLTGIAIPVAIHLLSRKEGKTISIGSIRHLRESPTAKFRHIRLNEIILLILRVLLVTVFVMLLAKPDLGVNARQKEQWLVLDTGVENDLRLSPLIDSLTGIGFEPRRLAPGFPAVDDPAVQPGGYWQLMEDLGTRPVDSAIVLSYNHLSRFNGKRVPLPPHVRWLTMDTDSITEPAWQLLDKTGTIWSREVSSKPDVTHFTTRHTRAGLGDPASTIRVSILYEAAFIRDARLIHAALKALETITPHTLEILLTSEPGTVRGGWTLWLSTQQPPHRMDSVIALHQCPIHNELFIRAEQLSPSCESAPAADWLMTSPLNRERALEHHLTVQLGSILLPETPVSFADRRVIENNLAWSSRPAVHPGSNLPDDHQERMLMVILLCLLVAERGLALRRNQ